MINFCLVFLDLGLVLGLSNYAFLEESISYTTNYITIRLHLYRSTPTKWKRVRGRWNTPPPSWCDRVFLGGGGGGGGGCSATPRDISKISTKARICARLKYDFFDFFRGCFGAFSTRKRTGSRPKTPPKKSFGSYFRRAQIRWVIWPSSKIAGTCCDSVCTTLCSATGVSARVFH